MRCLASVKETKPAPARGRAGGRPSLRSLMECDTKTIGESERRQLLLSIFFYNDLQSPIAKRSFELGEQILVRLLPCSLAGFDVVPQQSVGQAYECLGQFSVEWCQALQSLCEGT